MKLKVLIPFTDKYDASLKYQPGDQMICDDTERIDNLIVRGLCTVLSVKSEVASTEGAERKPEDPTTKDPEHQPEPLPEKSAAEELEHQPASKMILIEEVEYPLAKVKAALEAVGIEVNARAGVRDVAKKVEALDKEQRASLVTVLNLKEE